MQGLISSWHKQSITARQVLKQLCITQVLMPHTRMLRQDNNSRTASLLMRMQMLKTGKQITASRMQQKVLISKISQLEEMREWTSHRTSAGYYTFNITDCFKVNI